MGSCQLVMNTPVMTAESVITVPTDRSMPAGDDDERGAQRQHAVDRRRQQNADHVVELQEVRRGQRKDDEQDDQRRKRQQALRGVRLEERAEVIVVRGTLMSIIHYSYRSQLASAGTHIRRHAGWQNA